MQATTVEKLDDIMSSYLGVRNTWNLDAIINSSRDPRILVCELVPVGGIDFAMAMLCAFACME